MNSSFKFISYKVDNVELKAKKNLEVLVHGNFLDRDWKVRLGIRDPQYFVNQKIYVGGIDCQIFLNAIDRPEAEKTPENAEILINAGIAGSFESDAGQFPAEIESTLVKTQIPAILLPYLRGTITSLLANAGYGTILLPLINIQDYASKFLGDKKVQIIEWPINSPKP